MTMRCPSHPDTPEPTVCTSCAMIASRRRARRRGAIVFAALAVPVAAVAAYLFTRPHVDPPPPPREMDQLEQDMRARLAHDPCDHRTNLNLVEHMMDLDLGDVALADGSRSAGRCGFVGVIPWRMAYVHQQRHEWPAVAFLSTILIDREPRDSDFWWWRGEALAYAGHPWPAIADYRQSLANSDSAQAAGFAAARFADPAQAIGGRCEAARAWRYVARAFEVGLTQEQRDDYAALVRAGTCATDDGAGTAKIAIDRMTGSRLVTATIGGVEGAFFVDPSAGTSVVSRAFAARAGISAATADRGATLYGGARIAGQGARAAQIAVAGASAANVDVLISDDLQQGEDGVLGLSFLWHFDTAMSADGVIRLSPPRGALDQRAAR